MRVHNVNQYNGTYNCYIMAFYIMDRDKEKIPLTLVDLLRHSNVVRNWDYKS